MPKNTETDAEKPRRRVSVSRKPAQAEVPFEVSVAIAKAIADQDLDAMREIIINQERALAALSVIMFDLQTILRQESTNRGKAVTKERFNNFIRKFRKTVEANAPDLAAVHGDQDQVNDDLEALSDEETASIIEETFGPLSDWSNEPGDFMDDDNDEMEDALERASADTEDGEAGIARTSDRRIGPRSSGRRNR